LEEAKAWTARKSTTEKTVGVVSVRAIALEKTGIVVLHPRGQAKNCPLSAV